MSKHTVVLYAPGKPHRCRLPWFQRTGTKVQCLKCGQIWMKTSVVNSNGMSWLKVSE